nr:Virulence-associated protein and related proteins [Escherichia coli]
MRTVSIFKNGNNRAIRLPRDPDFDGVSELEIVREGDSIILRPVRPTQGLIRAAGQGRSGLYGGA